MSNGLKLLCFDLDDTLWPCAVTIEQAENQLYCWMQHQVPQITSVHSIDSLRQQRIEFMRRHPDLSHDLTRIRIASMHALADEFDLPHDWVEPGFALYYQARQQVSLFDDVTPALDVLAQNYRLSAITNGNASIDLTGVAHWFEFAVSAAEVGRAKPHPEIFQALLARAQTGPGEAVLIGDDPERDILGAAQLGMRTVWVNRTQREWPKSDYRPDAEIISFSNLADILRQLETES